MFKILKNIFSPAEKDGGLIDILKNDAYLVDVRSPLEYSSGSVKGAVNIPLDTIKSQLPKFQNKENIVVFCRSGARSSRAKSILKNYGIEGVINGGSMQNVQAALKA
ncbi:rhodanese-like domain-containing protein [Membranihabitans marinus]|uniref:rhodanese-like domain-containing protein n=1 Tax=Membranihabitans marinus TaxID=1227546 RepID=UPI001F1CFEA1|nr:rhodanese-like domain-containing protein [Membranihabitans marinus]